MDIICPKDKCTGCGACRDICPRGCISMIEDDLDALYPQIDHNLCVNCGLCRKTCPNNQEITFYHPTKCFAAWSLDSNNRKNSASGGIAAELYRYAINNNIFTVGVSWERKRGAYYIPVQAESDIEKVRNSKYVYSNTDGVFCIIKNKLDKGVSVLFIGLPCQIAGLYGYLRKEYDNLTTVDIICHGVAPTAYLEQHLSSIEAKKKRQTKTLSFRNPNYHTYTYSFTLSDKDNVEFYKKTVKSIDNYQLGYHHALIYRENCYQCSYARAERISDLTIGDFSGLGWFAECNYDRHNVNCVLVNTDKGHNLIGKLKEVIEMDERPLDEALQVEKQLQHPSIPHPQRKQFLDEYKKTHTFERAAIVSLRSDKFSVQRRWFEEGAKILIRRVVPAGVIKIIKKR